MTTFGGLFSHDRKAASALDSYTPDLSILPTNRPDPYSLVPNQAAPQGPMGTTLPLPGTVPSTSAAAGLPTPPPVKKRGAFDEEHRRQTLLALAAAFFGSNGLGEGLSRAASTIAGANDAARRKPEETIGGPDNAFMVTTDPTSGKQQYAAIPEFQDYLKDKEARVAAGKDRGPKESEYVTHLGSLAHGVSLLPPAQQAGAWTTGRNAMVQAGFDPDHLPETYDPIFASMGETVGQAKASEDRNTGFNIRQAHNGVVEAQGTTRLKQGAQRIDLQAQAGGRAQHAQAIRDLKAGVVTSGGVQYRQDPATGKLMMRKVP